jgi:uncharacterized membrane protein (UPF0127 family)
MARPTKALVRPNGDVVCERCVVADTPLSRMRGLLGKSKLPAEEGVLLRPAGSVHTLFMRFAIDVVFLDTNLCVLGVAERLRPWRAAGRRGAKAVVELAAGEAGRRGVRAGEVLELRA